MDRKDKAAAKTPTSNGSSARLISLFLCWKVLLLIVACASPGLGYDTSTRILLDQGHPSAESWLARAIEHVVLRLTRWDGIYFASSSTRGHVYEQEWAFSWVLARTTSAISRVVLSPFELSPIVKHALTGVLISHLSHLLTVVLLYYITLNIVPASPVIKRRVAFTAACLHITSPAGLFLSAPNSESPFALFNFTGTLCYIHAVQNTQSNTNPFRAALWTLAAGTSFGLAATIRSNGILSGILFAWDALATLSQPPGSLLNANSLKALAATVSAGIAVAVGFGAPQVIAYTEYCTAGNTRPWCSKIPPSIYTWVQDQYWGVGFLRYWTLNNLPLFLLAAPMIAVLLYISYIALLRVDDLLSSFRNSRHDIAEAPPTDQRVFKHILPRLAAPQLLLTVLATTSFHVQIINRLSSGYPVWYIVLAIFVQDAATKTTASRDSRPPARKAKKLVLRERHLRWVVRGMAMYAIVQGGLYASFLPPA